MVVEGEFAEEFVGGGVDDADVAVDDEEQDMGLRSTTAARTPKPCSRPGSWRRPGRRRDCHRGPWRVGVIWGKLAGAVRLTSWVLGAGEVV